MLRADLRALIGHEPHTLSPSPRGMTDAGWSPVWTKLGVFKDGAWEIWPWEKVLGGGWRKEPPALHWFTIDDTRECRLETPGELHIVFRERVQASTVMSASHDVTGGTVTLTARRAPRGSGAVEWLASASGVVPAWTDPTSRLSSSRRRIDCGGVRAVRMHPGWTRR